jgi:hypothetical protein
MGNDCTQTVPVSAFNVMFQLVDISGASALRHPRTGYGHRSDMSNHPSPLAIELPASGGSRSVRVRIEGWGCNWTVKSKGSFIRLVSKPVSRREFTIHISAERNQGSERSGVVDVGEQSVLVKQLGR